MMKWPSQGTDTYFFKTQYTINLLLQCTQTLQCDAMTFTVHQTH